MLLCHLYQLSILKWGVFDMHVIARLSLGIRCHGLAISSLYGGRDSKRSVNRLLVSEFGLLGRDIFRLLLLIFTFMLSVY